MSSRTAEVAVAGLTPGRIAVTAVGTVLATGLFYFILQALGTANLFWSTVSIATSFAAALTFFRSPWYAAAYAANDVVLIVLWLLAARQSPASLPVAVCFGLFLVNDSYGFLQWRKMQQRQA